jgi:serine/threonine protein kinase
MKTPMKMDSNDQGPVPPSGSACPQLLDLFDRLTECVRDGDHAQMEGLLRAYPEHEQRLRAVLPALGIMRCLKELSEGGMPADARRGVGAAMLGAGPMLGAGLPTEGLPDTTLGDFQIVREIGRGGMGVVYEAIQLSLRRRVAFKVLPFAALLDKRQLARFQNEARAAATLFHPHIVPVFFVGVERGVHFYAMQLIEGQSLVEVVATLRSDVAGQKSDVGETSVTGGQSSVMENSPATDHRPSTPDQSPTETGSRKSAIDTQAIATLSTEYSTNPNRYFRRVAEIGNQIAEALQHAHEHGIVHRDIKPANILLDDDGKAWITDFGLARLEADPSMTASGDVLGTLRYMSPEQAAGDRAVGHRADIYSLGITLYELAASRPAFGDTDRQSLLRRIAEDDPRPLRLVHRQTPVDFETIICKSIEKNPNDRYRTARELADDLRRFLQDKPLSARRPGLMQQVVKWTRRHRVMVTTAAVTFLLSLIVGMVLVARAYRLEQEQRQIAEQQRSKAERSLEFARQAVDDMYTGIAMGWLAKESAASNLQTNFLNRALEFYQRLADEPPKNLTELKAAAEVYERIGDIDYYLRRRRSAVKALKHSIDTSEQLLAEKPDSRDDRLAIVARYGRSGDWLKDLGDLKAADAAHEKSRDHLQVLSDRFPDPTGYRDYWGRYHLSRANLLMKMDELGKAEENAGKAREIFDALFQERLAASQNKNSPHFETSLLLIKSTRCLAEILQRQERPSEAQSHFENALHLCESLRNWVFSDSRQLIEIEGGLDGDLAALHQAEGRLVDAERHFRQSLDLQRRALKSGLDPAQFLVRAAQGKANFDDGFQEVEFCDYAETQLRLALVLSDMDRPYETEKVLGECLLTTAIIADTDPNNVRYRVARANAWAQIGQLLASKRSDESCKFWQYAAVIWQSTLAKFPGSGQYRSGVHGDIYDAMWFQDRYPPDISTDNSLEYIQFKEPCSDSPFSKHAAGLNWYRSGNYKVAIEYFTKAAEARKCDHAFDWFYLAMSHQQLGETAEAGLWYDKAMEAIEQANNTDPELLHLANDAKEMLEKPK